MKINIAAREKLLDKDRVTLRSNSNAEFTPYKSSNSLDNRISSRETIIAIRNKEFKEKYYNVSTDTFQRLTVSQSDFDKL